MRLPRLTFLALLALAPACQDASGSDLASVTTGSGATSTQSLIDRIPDASTRLAYQGVRRVRMNYDVLGAHQELEYLERVSSDGEGGFAVQVLDVDVPSMPQADLEFFRLMQRERQGFLFRNRDFGIRDIDLFRDGYRIVQVGEAPIQVAGRTSLEFEVERREDARRSYLLAVDALTGLVLRHEERLRSGAIVSSATFETIVYGVPAEPVDYYDPIDRTPIDLDQPTEPQVGFALLRPALVPPGYRLHRADSFEDRGRRWARLVYGDGVEEMFFLHSPVPPDNDVPGTGGSGLVGGPAGSSGSLATSDDRVVVAAVGPWYAIEGTVAGQGVIVLSKASEDALLQMIQSAVETRSGS